MLGSSWSIGLLICTTATLFLIGLASITGTKILLYWDSDSDSEYQIDLEGRTWLAAALVESGLAVQLLSLFLLVIAATDFSGMIVGAMCATGSFLANEYGPKSLYIKIAGLFFYGFWILLHRLDLCSESSPLIRIKFIYLLILLPYLFFDSYYLISYLYNLKPDIITSCCGVIFTDKALQTNFLLMDVSTETVVGGFYLLAVVVMVMGWVLARKIKAKIHIPLIWHCLYAILMTTLFLLSLVTITIYFSSYIYAMPYHNCPFDILHKEYNYIGYPIYFTLFSAAFLGITSGAASFFHKRPGLAAPLGRYQQFAMSKGSFLIVIYVVLVTYPVLRYLLFGGEI
jgi:hypothetical protein